MAQFESIYHRFTEQELKNLPSPLDDADENIRLVGAMDRVSKPVIREIFAKLTPEGEKNFRRRMKTFYKSCSSLSTKTSVRSQPFINLVSSLGRDALTSSTGTESTAYSRLNYIFTNYWAAVGNQLKLEMPAFRLNNCEEVLDFFDAHFSSDAADIPYWIALCDSALFMQLDNWYYSERFAMVRRKVTGVRFFGETQPISSRRDDHVLTEDELKAHAESFKLVFETIVKESEGVPFSYTELAVDFQVNVDWLRDWLKHRADEAQGQRNASSKSETSEESREEAAEEIRTLKAQPESAAEPQVKEEKKSENQPQEEIDAKSKTVQESKSQSPSIKSSEVSGASALEAASEPVDGQPASERFTIKENASESFRSSAGSMKSDVLEEIEFPIDVPVDSREEGTLFTGVLSVVTKGASTYYNFYPKFVWTAAGAPQVLSKMDFKYRIPGSSIALRTQNNIRRNYRCLKNGALINVRVIDEIVFESGLAKLAHEGGFLLDDLYHDNRIMLSEEAPEKYRAYYFFRELSSTSEGDVRVEPSEPSPGMLFPPDLSVMVKGKHAVYGPLKVRQLAGAAPVFVGNKSSLSDGLALKDCCLTYYPTSPSSAFSFSNKIGPDDPWKTYEVFFTSPLLNKICLEDLAAEKALYERLTAAAEMPRPDREENRKKILALAENFPAASPYKALLDRRIRKMENFADFSEKAASVLTQYTDRLIENWSEAARRNPDNAKILLTELLKAPGAMDTVLAADEVVKARTAERTKAAAELDKLTSEKEALNDQIRLIKEKFEEEKRRMDQLGGAIKLSELLPKLKAQKDQTAKELADIQTKLETEKQAYEQFDSAMNRYEDRLSQTKAKIAELHLDKVITDMLGANSSVQDRVSKTGSEGAVPSGSRETDDPEIGRRRVEALRRSTKIYRGSEELVQDLLSTIKQARNYDNAEIINLLTCISTGFLTVLAGAPGSGKTTLSDILGAAFGLNTLSAMEEIREMWGQDADIANRYLPVQVERGWTSKRDFIGYYNPLTETFECGDEQRYESLKILDLEQRMGAAELPYLILLDEANLSPIEYYFADFMNIGERRAGENFIALGDHHRYKIGENLRVIATLNTDHTTERLSPRMLDRSWIITLPESRGFKQFSNVSKFPENRAPISWKQFAAAFKPAEKINENGEWPRKLERIIEAMEKMNVHISRRSLLAVLNYISAAEPWMARNARDSALKAADFAVCQRFLPQIAVYENVGEAFEQLYSLLEETGLNLSASTLRRIIRNGDEIKGYSFF